MRLTTSSVVLCLLLAGSFGPAIAAPVIADHRAADGFDAIPESYFQSVRDQFRFFYGRTSHGSQIGTGIDLLAAVDPVRYADVTMAEFSVDLGDLGNLNWVTITRDYLAQYPECNAVMWAWCGGVSYNTTEGIDAYLQAMHQLESDFPNVLFIYMTGHLDGTGPDGVLYRNNDQIREWCVSRGKVLFDFADIESWNPDGTWFPYETDACAWCADWCATHPCPACADCAHSHCFNCWRKGRAFWWMMARVLGWQPQDTLGGTGGLARLGPAHPNPFAGATTIDFALSEPGQVRLEIVDAAGRLVAVLADGYLSAGRHVSTWEGVESSGRRAPAGVYFARFTGPRGTRTERLVLVR